MAYNFVKKETPVQVYFDIWGYFFLQKTCFLWFHFLCCCLYLITLQAWRPESLLKALVNIAKCLRTALLKDYLWISESRRQLLQWLLSEEYRTVECSRYIYIYIYMNVNNTAQQMNFSIKDFFSKCDHWSLLLKKSLRENLIFMQCKLISLKNSA